MKLSRRHWLWAGIAVAVAAAGLIAVLAPIAEWEDALETRLDEAGLLTGMLIYCAAAIAGSLLLIPAWIFAVAAGAVFGFGWGLAAATIASTLGALVAFLVARYALRDRIERIARRNETFVAVDKAVKREPWKVVALLRMSPVLPSSLKSYFLGLTCIEPLAYTLATLAGMLPGLLFKVYIGHAGRDALGGGGTTKWVLLACGVAATVAMAIIVGRAAKKRLRLD
jgi:uncharacterized membrane protein YdjX (TVP38/TMEM64 family)